MLAIAPLAAERADARGRVERAGLLRTPLIDSPGLGEEHGCEVRLKLEAHQLTGSFKVRGALVAVARAPRSETVVTASAGNHGLAIAFACSSLGRAAEIFVPGATDEAKLAALARFGEGIGVRVVDGSYDDTERAAREAAQRAGTVFISSYNDPHVIAGQSTVASEALAQWPEAEAVLVPVGGGGLLGGVGLACADHPSPVAAWGVEPESSPAMHASLQAGRIVPIVEEEPSAAQGLVGNLDSESITFPLVREHSDGVLLATEQQILDAVTRIYADHAIVAEPSGAAAVCGLQDVVAAGARRIICVLTGSNVAAATHFGIVSARMPTAGQPVPPPRLKVG
ncbi:MAG TPA: pyridoxal-phosphate dependent enzyme [Solirubrobacteraceae bacterium]|jgi:threonine dehydratase